jgi:hypothetical protein
MDETFTLPPIVLPTPVGKTRQLHSPSTGDEKSNRDEEQERTWGRIYTMRFCTKIFSNILSRPALASALS